MDEIDELNKDDEKILIIATVFRTLLLFRQVLVVSCLSCLFREQDKKKEWEWVGLRKTVDA